MKRLENETQEEYKQRRALDQRKTAFLLQGTSTPPKNTFTRKKKRALENQFTVTILLQRINESIRFAENLKLDVDSYRQWKREWHDIKDKNPTRSDLAEGLKNLIAIVKENLPKAD